MLALPLNKAFFHLPYGFYLTTCKSGPYWKRLFFICALLNWLSLCWKSEFKIFSRWIDSLPWHDHPSMAMKEKITVIPEECILYFLQKCWDIFHTCSITKNVQLVLWGSARFKTFFRSRRRLQKAGYHTDIKNSREVIEEGNKFTIFFLFF